MSDKNYTPVYNLKGKCGVCKQPKMVTPWMDKDGNSISNEIFYICWGCLE